MRKDAMLLGLIVAGCTGPFTDAGQPDPLGKPAAVSPAIAEKLARSQKPDEPRPPDLAPKLPDQAPAGGDTAARTIAFVNDNPIFEGEIREAVYQHLPELLAKTEAERPALMREIYQAELQKVIERELILDDMFAKLDKKPRMLDDIKSKGVRDFERRIRDLKKDRRIGTDEELNAMLATQGLSLAGIKRQIERNYMMMEYVRGRVYPAMERMTLAQIREYYESHTSEFRINDRVKWMDIFIDSSRFATQQEAKAFSEQVAAYARTNVEFTDLVKQYDCGDAKFRNGIGIGEEAGKILPQIVEPEVFRLKPGEVGIVDLGSGYHIVKVVDRIYAGRLPFDEKTQNEVRKRIQAQIAEREYKSMIEELRGKAVIQVLKSEP